ncbi:MAG: hypothetical protein HOP11_14455 [Saprospiraceae bacterium]|nr:hypothetical protein [Saprospiraceae bacterium]
MKKLNIYYLLVITSLLTFSCDLTEDPDVGGTNTKDMAGEWYLQLIDPADSVTVYVDYSLATTSNTAANVADKMLFDDAAHFFHFQCKMNTNQQNLTFNAENAENIQYDPAHTPPAAKPKPIPAIGSVKTQLSATPKLMTITNGTITKNSFSPPSKTKTDFLSCLMTGIYRGYNYVAESYAITGTDTSVVWKLRDESDVPDGPYIISGYKRTGFLEDEH